MNKFVGLRAKKYTYLKENNDENRKAKSTKKCVIKRKLKFQDYKDCLKAALLERKINYLGKKIKISVECLKRLCNKIKTSKRLCNKKLFWRNNENYVESLKAYSKKFV